MMEYEELLRARAYVEALAEGRDPESGETLSLADARCAECLSFVSDVLSHAAARIAPPKPETRPVRTKPLTLTEEQRAAFPFSDKPISGTEFVKRVNALISDPAMRRLSYTVFSTWLVDRGLLQWEYASDGMWVKRPTDAGRYSDIRVAARQGAGRVYHATLYGPRIQRFMLDAFDEVEEADSLWVAQRRMPWTIAEDKLLAERCRTGRALCRISAELKRSPAAVEKRMRELGLAIAER